MTGNRVLICSLLPSIPIFIQEFHSVTTCMEKLMLATQGKMKLNVDLGWKRIDRGIVSDFQILNKCGKPLSQSFCRTITNSHFGS